MQAVPAPDALEVRVVVRCGLRLVEAGGLLWRCVAAGGLLRLAVRGGLLRLAVNGLLIQRLCGEC